MTITMLTERKALAVSPAFLRGSPSTVEVDVCLTCGAVVFDIIRHDLWHTSVATAEPGGSR